MEKIEDLINNLIKRIELLEDKINILLAPKTKITNDTNKKIIRDKTKYMFKGIVYSKNKLVLAVISDYVLQNPKVSFEYLSKLFDKSLQGSLGVVRRLSEIKNRKDAAKRFFTNNVIKLHSGEEVVVCTQWGAFNIDRFILCAASLNFEIEKII